jgi:excisionase family DNA binding protein
MSDRLALIAAELAAAIVDMVRAELAAEAGAPDRLLSVEAAAEALSIGRTMAWGEIQAGRLRSVKVGRRRLVPSSAIAEYVTAANGRA